MSSHHSTSLSCFRPTTADNHRSPPSQPPQGNPNLTTCLYHTNLGIFSLTWSRTFLGHSLHLQLHHHDLTSATSSAASSPVSLSSYQNNPLSLITIFNLHVKPFTFWKKSGSKKLSIGSWANAQIFWDLTRVKFGSRPEPNSGFYIAVVVDGEITLLVGDLIKLAQSKTKSELGLDQVLILRREHVFGNKIYTTKARFGGREREISIDCTLNCDARLVFCVDNKRVLTIKRLKWKFRGNEKIEIDGIPIQVSWDVYNWLFDSSDHGHAVFMFKFEDLSFEEDRKLCCIDKNEKINKSSAAVNGGGGGGGGLVSFGLNGIEWKKMRSLLRTARSSSSSSISMTSSASSGCSSSVSEWASSTTEESELNNGPVGFSLLVYAWKK